MLADLFEVLVGALFDVPSGKNVISRGDGADDGW
jgi:hypothetical protein